MTNTNTNLTSCNTCYYCNSCECCDYCEYCKSCNYCKNLKMTEHNLFCYSENYNEENSFQQTRYRAFNKEVGEQRYYEIKNLVFSIIPNPEKLKLSDFWKSITQSRWQKLLAIPEASDFKDGFEYISGCKVEDTKPEQMPELAEIKKAFDEFSNVFNKLMGE